MRVGTRSRLDSRGDCWPHRWRQLLGVALGITAVALVCGSIIFLGTLPSVDDAEARVAGRLRGGQDTGLPLPDSISAAVVAVEDGRFYVHHGIDARALLRASWVSLTGGPRQGGDTITEQLAKILYVGNDHGVRRRLATMVLAVKLEAHYTKEQILEMYLNAVYFGDGQWGVTQASQTYFGKPPAALDWAEASLLAGLPQAPSSYDPIHHFTLARARQRDVLAAMVHDQMLTRAQADRAYAELTTLRR